MEKQIGAVFVQRKVVPAHWEYECPTCGTWLEDFYGGGGRMNCHVCCNTFYAPSPEELLEEEAQHDVTYSEDS